MRLSVLLREMRGRQRSANVTNTTTETRDCTHLCRGWYRLLPTIPLRHLLPRIAPGRGNHWESPVPRGRAHVMVPRIARNWCSGISGGRRLPRISSWSVVRSRKAAAGGLLPRVAAGGWQLLHARVPWGRGHLLWRVARGQILAGIGTGGWLLVLPGVGGWGYLLLMKGGMFPVRCLGQMEIKK